MSLAAARLNEAGIALFSALYGRDFRAENDLLGSLHVSAPWLGWLHDPLRMGWKAWE